MKNVKAFIVGIGEVLWDVFTTGKKLGGAPANFAYHAAQFNKFDQFYPDSLVVSAIGYDKEGSEIIRELEGHSLPYHLDRVTYPTGTVVTDISDPNNPSYDIKTRVAWSHIPLTDELREIASRTMAVCFGTLAQWGRESRNTILSFLDSCPEDCLKICDINLRQSYYTKTTIKECLRRADILKLNEEELYIITTLLDYKMAGEENLCRRLMGSYGINTIILTKGIHGSWILWQESSKKWKSFQPAPEVKVADTVGAGDAFTGAYVASLLNSLSIEQAHEVAAKVAAYVCTQKGAMPEIPSNLLSVGTR